MPSYGIKTSWILTEAFVNSAQRLGTNIYNGAAPVLCTYLADQTNHVKPKFFEADMHIKLRDT